MEEKVTDRLMKLNGNVTQGQQTARIMQRFPYLSALLMRVKSSPIGSRLAHGIFWGLIGTVLTRGLSVLASIISARLLGQEAFGALGIVQGAILTLSITVGYPIGLAATKYIAEFRVADPAKAGRILLLIESIAYTSAFLIAIFFFISAPWISDKILVAPYLAKPLRIGSLLLFISCINSIQTGALAGFEAFRSIAMVNFIAGIMIFAGTVAGVIFDGIEGAIWGIALGTLIGSIAAHLALRGEVVKSKIILNRKFLLSEVSLVAHFSLPSFLSSVLFSPINWACSAILVRQPDGYAEMGIFNACNQWFALVLFLPGIVSQVILPILSDSEGRGNSVDARSGLFLALKANIALVAPSVAVLSLVSPWLMSLYGDSFAKGWQVMILSLVAAGIHSIQMPASQLLNARGKVWSIFKLNLFWAILFFALTLAFIQWGAQGLAGARLVAFTFQGLALFLFMRRI